MLLKELDYERCPWCGEQYVSEKINYRRGILDGYGDRMSCFCRACGKWGRRSAGRSLVSILIIGLLTIILGIDVRNTREFLLVFLFLMLIWGDGPYYRTKKDGTILTPEEEFLCYANIRWYSWEEGGVGLPRLRIKSGRIFPVCFVDESNVPVTQIGCVRIRKHFLISFKRAKIRAITDLIHQEQIHIGGKFYIYNQHEIIGEGIVCEKRDSNL